MKDLNEVRETLIDMLEDLDERLGKITNDSKQNNEHVAQDIEKQACEAEANISLSSFGSAATRQEMEQIKLAISRIDDGTYGVCLSCGKRIKKERLSTIVFSSQCIRCTEK